MSKKPTNRGTRKTAKRAALSAYAQTGNLRLALEAARIGRRTHYDWLRDDPEYAAAFERAREEAADRPAEPMMLIPIGGRLVPVPAPQPAAGAKDQVRPQDLGRKADRSRKHPTGNPRKPRKPKAGSVE